MSEGQSEAMSTCAMGHPARARLRFVSAAEPVDKCLRHALVHPRVVRTALATAAVVGTILTFINQGNLMFAGEWRADMAWKIPMTYCVPYGVVTWSALRTAWRG